MVASYLKPSVNSCNGMIRLNHIRQSTKEKKRNQNFLKPILASICFLMCIAFVPERPTHLASICEKHNSAVACKIW